MSTSIVRLARLAVMLALPAVAHASSRPCDTTKKSTEQRSTLLSAVRIAAIHMDLGASTVAGGDSAHVGAEGKLSIAFCRWPEWTFGLGGASATPYKTDYTVGSNGFRPSVYLDAAGISLERRWKEGSIVHPMLLVGFGSVSAEYRYSHYEQGSWIFVREETSHTDYLSVAGGAEINLTSWMRLDALIGGRKTGRLQTTGADPYAASGSTVSVLFGFGKY